MGKKHGKKEKKRKSDHRGNGSADSSQLDKCSEPLLSDNSKKQRLVNYPDTEGPRPVVESSALPDGTSPGPEHCTSLLLFYQYVEPPWSDGVYKMALGEVEQVAKTAGVTGRMRVAKEGLNCTLTGSASEVVSFCTGLRNWKPSIFYATEFKITHHLTERDRFRDLKIIPVIELVHYGLEGEKAPPIKLFSGVHLEPHEYHKKLAEDNTVVIDVRNHYEANIGRFDPPGAEKKFIDPMMRRSTEFPVWLDSEETRQKIKGKQVLMYCTGGIRCERASALLKYKIETDPTMAGLGIQGVYQLQGGIDKYFKAFPDGGYWKGKNYTFDKRFAHAPVVNEAEDEMDRKATPMGKCEACHKPWDKYRGKRRCPACGVPSLICKECYLADQNGTKKLDKNIRCDLCVAQGIRSKKEIRAKEQTKIEEYERRQESKGLLKPPQLEPSNPNPGNVTRLFLRNMCRKNMTDDVLIECLPGITHLVWKTDRKTKQFLGQGWVEMESPEAAAAAVAKSGIKILGRPIFIEYQKADSKDMWPPAHSSVRL